MNIDSFHNYVMKSREEELARVMKQKYKDMVQLLELLKAPFLFQNFHFNYGLGRPLCLLSLIIK